MPNGKALQKVADLVDAGKVSISQTLKYNEQSYSHHKTYAYAA